MRPFVPASFAAGFALAACVIDTVPLPDARDRGVSGADTETYDAAGDAGLPGADGVAGLGQRHRILLLIDAGALGIESKWNLGPLLDELVVDLAASGATVDFAAQIFDAGVFPTPAFGACPTFLPSLPPFDELAAPIAPPTLADLQATLHVARAQIEADLANIAGASCAGLPAAGSAAQLHYAVIVVMAGEAEPRCTAGLGNDLDPLNPSEPYSLCEDDNFIACLLQRDLGLSGGTVCADGVCTYGDQTCFAQANAQDGLFGNFPALPSELAGGVAYNTPASVDAKSQALIQLATTHGLGGVRLHAVALLPWSAVDCAAVTCAPGFDDLLRSLATTGGGTYSEFWIGETPTLDAIDVFSP